MEPLLFGSTIQTFRLIILRTTYRVIFEIANDLRGEDRSSFFPFSFFFSEGSRLKSRQKGIFTYFSKVEFQKKKKSQIARIGKVESVTHVILSSIVCLPPSPGYLLVPLFSYIRKLGSRERSMGMQIFTCPSVTNF